MQWKRFIIKVNQQHIFNNAVVIIDNFREYCNSKNNILGDPKEIGKAAINAILRNPDEKYAWSPGLFQSKVTSRKPWKLRKNVGQWISRIIFVLILTINIMNIHIKSKSLNKIWVNSCSHNIHLALGKSWRISFTNSKYSEFEHFKNCVNLWNFLFRALNYSKLEDFRALKSPKLEDFRALKSSNLAIGF